MHKGPPFYRQTGTSRYSKVFQGLTDLLPTSGLLKVLDCTYHGKAQLLKLPPPLWRQEPQLSWPLSLLLPSPFIYPAPALGAALPQVFYECAINPPRALWGKCRHLHSTGEEAEASGNADPKGRGRFETECVQHHCLWLFQCSLMSELLFNGHLFSSRHGVSRFKYIFISLKKQCLEVGLRSLNWSNFPRSSQLVNGRAWVYIPGWSVVKLKILNSCLWHKLNEKNNPALTGLDVTLDKTKLI